MANRMKALYNQVIFERRILLSCTAFVGLSVCIWSVAIGTDYWFTLKSPDNQGLLLKSDDKVRRILLYKHVGLWRSCIMGLTSKSENSTLVQYYECKYLNMFPTDMQIKLDPSLNVKILTACNMVVIQVLLSSIEYENNHIFETSSKNALIKYDYSLILAWIVFLFNFVAGLVFVLFSKKRKRDKAPTEEIAMADEPTIIGR
ncbi:uncharacterized protein LOC105835075 isoform X2 [Monomorium pharaonis]|uniref:uncharacterized protein LOC105835075 isoform X2 n=1 Tax=Monomorium pharaonis TaxID=307658 RepID=UPI0017465935|nr:uncharacterized protein LOC105835075 isoform X2 [Monomorium pharaonis]